MLIQENPKHQSSDNHNYATIASKSVLLFIRNTGLEYYHAWINLSQK